MAERRLRILFVINSLVLGGAQRQLVTLARGLKGRGHEVAIATFRTGGIFEAEAREAGVRLIALETRGVWSLARVVARLRAEVRDAGFDVVHSYLPAENVATALLRLASPGTRVVWGVRASDPVLRQYGLLASLTSRLERRLSRLAHRIVFNSRAGLRAFGASGFHVGRAVVIANGLDTQVFRPDAAQRQAVRREWGIAGDAPLVGLVARLDPMKDYGSFLRAAAEVARAHPEARFASISQGLEGDYGRSMRELARTLALEPRLAWLTGRSDMPAVYNALDVVVLSSASGEGFPNVLAEAMACGKPCVCTDVGDSAAVVGAFGEVVPPADPARLAAAIGRAIDSRAVFDAAAARERVAREFGTARLVDETEAELLRVVSAGTTSPALAA